MGNKQRIIDATVELMNRDGSAVGTTQLTEYLSISPGNLYYHFRNREEILAEVLTRLQTDLDEVLILAADELPDAQRLAEVFIGGAKVLWRYRFFFSSSLELVANDQLLADRYRHFCRRGIKQVDHIIKQVLKHAAGSQPASAAERRRLAETLWVLWTSWPRYIETAADTQSSETEMLRNHEALELILKPYLASTFYRSVVSRTRKLQALEDQLAE